MAWQKRQAPYHLKIERGERLLMSTGFLWPGTGDVLKLSVVMVSQPFKYNKRH